MAHVVITAAQRVKIILNATEIQQLVNSRVVCMEVVM
jgi:hypothetical protein